MTTRSTPASSIIASARSMVNGSGNSGLAPGSQAQSGEFAFQKCTWASTIVRLPAGCGRACCTLVVSAAPATSVVPMNLRRVSMMVLPDCAALGGVSSLEDCNLGTAKRNPGPRSFDRGNVCHYLVRALTVQGDKKVTWIRMLILALALAAIGGVATAQDDFPSKSVHIYVPFPPGGAVDIVGRTLGDELSKRWGQTVVIENRPGARGTIATQALAKAPADGYTLSIIATGHAIHPHLYDKLPYATLAD